jgi:hypothetical protein
MRVIGAQDLEIGEPHFDEDVIIKGNDLAFVSAWLTREVRLLVRAAYPASFEVIRGRMRCVIRTQQNRRALRPYFRAAAALAGQGFRLMRRWRETAHWFDGTVSDTEHWEPGGRAWIDLPIRGERVRIDSVFDRVGTRGRPRLLTRVRCKRTASDPIECAILPVDSDVKLPRELTPIPIRQDALREGWTLMATRPAIVTRIQGADWSLIGEVDPYAVVCGADTVEIFIDGFESRRERLAPAAELAVRLGTEIDRQTGGPYR